MGKGAWNRKKREQAAEQQAARVASSVGDGLFGMQPTGGPFGADLHLRNGD